MRLLAWSIVSWAWMAGLVSAGAPNPGEDETPAPGSSGAGLVAHEWGTFTNFSGSDGVNLDFRPLVDNDLPEFVFTPYRLSGLAKRNITARQRMETPVIYFYSEKEREVRVSVQFRDGQITEFFPPIQSPKDEGAVLGMTKLDRIDWGTVHVIPESRLQTSIEHPELARDVNRRIALGLVPWTDRDNHYYEARAVDAALLMVREANPWGESPMCYFEKFLFYRGVGQFPTPMRVEALGSGRVRLVNDGVEPLRSAFLLEVLDGALRFAPLEAVEKWSSVEAQLPAWDDAGEHPAEALKSRLTQALIAEGLFEKEARAMVATWESSWLREPGVRVLCTVPQPFVDTILPLAIDPAPESLVRAFVARLEVLPPEDEQHLNRLLTASAAGGVDAEEELFELLQERGRLAEPMLQLAARGDQNPRLLAAIDRLKTMLAERQ